MQREPDPVVYLKSIVYKINSESGLQMDALKQMTSPFLKPEQKDLDSYDLDIVMAIRNREVAKLRALIAEGKSMNACNRFGESLIHMACRRGYEDIVELLIIEGEVRLDATDDFGRTPLHDACWTSKPNFVVMDLLIQACPAYLLLAEDIRGHTPFHYARREHWDDWVRFLQKRSDLIRRKFSIYA